MQLFRILLMFLLAPVPGWLMAQRVVVSQEVALRNEASYELLKGAGDRVILYRQEPGTLTLHSYNMSMEQEWSREIILDKNRPIPMGAMISKGEIVLFYTYRKDRGTFLKLHRYSDRGNLTDSLTLGQLTGDFERSNYVLLPTADGRYALLVQQRDAVSSAVLGVEVATGRILYQQIAGIEGLSAVYDQMSFPKIDESGAVYFWAERNNRRSKLDEHVLDLLRVNIDGSTQAIQVPVQEALVYDLEMEIDELNRQIVFAGYYADNPDEAAGALSVKLPYDLQGQASISTFPFPEDILNAVDPRSKKTGGIPNLDALNIVFRRDGAVLLVGEQRRATVRTVGGRGTYFGGTFKTDYLYEDIVLCSIDGAEAYPDWFEVLPKKQFSQDDGAAFSGYMMFVTPSAIRLIHNDEVRSGGTVSEYTLNGSGNIERHSIMNTEYQDVWLRMEAGIQVSGNALVIPSERRNKLRLVYVAF